MIEAALKLLDNDQCSIRTEVYRKHKIGGEYLISSLKANQTPKIIAILLNMDQKKSILSALGLKSILAHKQLNEIIDVLVSERLTEGLICIASSLTNLKKDSKSNSTIASQACGYTF